MSVPDHRHLAREQSRREGPQVERCSCGHAHQIHVARGSKADALINPDTCLPESRCRGVCGQYGHELADHAGRCTAGTANRPCPCDGFSPKNRSAA